MVCGVTVLARLFDPGHHRQVDQRPGNTASSARNVIIEAVSSTVDGARCGSGWRVMRWAAIVSETTNRAVSEQPETCKGLPMSKVKYISSPNGIPAGQKYVLVIYGEEHAQTEHPLGLTITVARTVSQLSFLTAVHTAKKIAKHAGISEVFSAPPRHQGQTPPPPACSLTFPPMTNLART
jgi:hypothetical protein